MTTLEILEGARDLIREPGDWHQGSAIRGRAGCLWTAVHAATLGCKQIDGILAVDRYKDQAQYNLAEGVLSRLTLVAQRLDPFAMGAICFNDSHTHAEVLELFNLAIAAEIVKEREGRAFQEEAEREAAEDPAAPMVFA